MEISLVSVGRQVAGYPMYDSAMILQHHRMKEFQYIIALHEQASLLHIDTRD
jgi:hypothetical protein